MDVAVGGLLVQISYILQMEQHLASKLTLLCLGNVTTYQYVCMLVLMYVCMYVCMYE